MSATFATATDTGRVRASNEDALYARPPVFMVADGMGGPQGGEIASGITAKAFEWYMPQGQDGEQELTKLIKKINANIFQLAVAENRPGMGTTVTAALLAGGSVVLAHVGDSRAYLWRGGGLRQLTDDHSLVAEMVRSGELSPDEASSHPQRSVITRALGVDEAVEVDTQRLDWEPGDVFLLCSDGLYSMLADAEIAGVMERWDDLNGMAAALVNKANENGGHDNISVVLFCPDGSLQGETAGESDTGVLRLPDHADFDFELPLEKPGASGAAPPRGVFGRIRHNWLLRTAPGQIITGVGIMLILLAGGWFGTRQIYFLGVADGRIVIYQGVPYSIGPLDLFSASYKSPVRYDDLASFEQEAVDRQELHSHSTARQILDNYSAEMRQRQQQQQAAQAAAAAAGTDTTAGPGNLSGTSAAGPGAAGGGSIPGASSVNPAAPAGGGVAP